MDLIWRTKSRAYLVGVYLHGIVVSAGGVIDTSGFGDWG